MTTQEATEVSFRERYAVYLCVRDGKRERESVYVCVSVCLCVCMCMWQ